MDNYQARAQLLGYNFGDASQNGAPQPGDPNYADYYGLGGTQAAADQASRNANVNMGEGTLGAIQNPTYGAPGGNQYGPQSGWNPSANPQPDQQSPLGYGAPGGNMYGAQTGWNPSANPQQSPQTPPTPKMQSAAQPDQNAGGGNPWIGDSGAPLGMAPTPGNMYGPSTGINQPQTLTGSPYAPSQPGGNQYGPQSGWGNGSGLFGLGSQVQAQGNSAYAQAPTGIQAPANLPNGAPDFFGLANAQSGYNVNNALYQSMLNNPNYYGPGGSQQRVQNPDGSWSVVQSLNPTLQQGYDQQNALKSQLLGNAGQLAGQGPLNYNSLGGMPQFNTSGVQGIPTADSNDLSQTRDSVYQQATQYLDPQFQQQQSDLENKLANQGITPGSDAYNRAMLNFNNQKQQAYNDARNSAIQAGGAEQSRLFGLGLSAHTTGMNDALAGFNTGMQSRQQGVSELNQLHNSPINDLNALNGLTNTVQLPNYPGQVGTSIPGVDYMNAGQQQYNANTGINNANAAQHQSTVNGLYGLGSAFLQSGAGQNILNNFFGGNQGAYGSWLANNQPLLDAGLTPQDILGAA